MDSVLIRSLDGFAAGIRKLNDAAIYVGILTISVISTVALIGVVARLIGRPMGWVLEFSELAQVVLAFVPVAYVLNQGAHVRMDMVIDLLSGKRRHLVQGIASILGMCMCILMIYATAQTAMGSIAMSESSEISSLPIYPLKVVVTVGFFLLALQFAGHAWESFRSILFEPADTRPASPQHANR